MTYDFVVVDQHTAFATSAEWCCADCAAVIVPSTGDDKVVYVLLLCSLLLCLNRKHQHQKHSSTTGPHLGFSHYLDQQSTLLYAGPLIIKTGYACYWYNEWRLCQ
jgi:hypothetical protein